MSPPTTKNEEYTVVAHANLKPGVLQIFFILEGAISRKNV